MYNIMNKHQNLASNQGLVPKMTRPKLSLKSFLEKLKQKQGLIQFRNEILASSNRLNYMSEYDRISGLLHASVTHRHIDHNRLLNRQAELKMLHEQSYNPIKHEITKK